MAIRISWSGSGRPETRSSAGQEDEGPAQDPHQDQVPAGILGADGRGELADPLRDPFAGEQEDKAFGHPEPPPAWAGSAYW
jgi:hypothetical protein